MPLHVPHAGAIIAEGVDTDTEAAVATAPVLAPPACRSPRIVATEAAAQLSGGATMSSRQHAAPASHEAVPVAVAGNRMPGSRPPRQAAEQGAERQAGSVSRAASQLAPATLTHTHPASHPDRNTYRPPRALQPSAPREDILDDSGSSLSAHSPASHRLPTVHAADFVRDASASPSPRQDSSQPSTYTTGSPSHAQARLLPSPRAADEAAHQLPSSSSTHSRPPSSQGGRLMPPEVMSSTAAPPSPARVHIGEDVEWHTRRKGASEPSRAQHVVDAATGVAAGSAWGAPPDAHHHLWGAASSPTAQRLSASVPPDSDFAGRTTSEFVRDQVNSQADRQVQYVLDGPFDEELQQKLISVIVDHKPASGASSTGPRIRSAASLAADKEAADIEQAMMLSTLTDQPNDPRVHPIIGERLPLGELLNLLGPTSTLGSKLAPLARCFPEYRSVIGDGNCFYRCFACGLIEHLSHRPKVAAKEFKARLDELMGLLQQAGLADHNCRQAYKIRWRPILSDIARQEDWTAVEIVAAALQYLRDEHSGLVLWLLRALAACELLQRREVYERFLPGLEGLRRLPEGAEGMEAVVSGLVLQDGVDAEHPMIQALSTLLRVPLAVVYASGDAPVRVQLIEPMPEEPADLLSNGVQPPEPFMFMLFRQGHYDLLYPEGDQWRSLPQQC